MWKNYGTAVLVCLAFLTPIDGAGQTLRTHLWKDRVLLLFGPEPGEAYWNQANAALEQHAEGMLDRDMVVYRVMPKAVSGPHRKKYAKQDVENFWRNYGMEQGRSGWVLIGKDGGVKEKGTGQVDLKRLFALIDQMPMRRREMQSGKN